MRCHWAGLRLQACQRTECSGPVARAQCHWMPPHPNLVGRISEQKHAGTRKRPLPPAVFLQHPLLIKSNTWAPVADKKCLQLAEQEIKNGFAAETH